jgi:S1-C subfamily serine protease
LTPDPASPSGYALLPGDDGVSVERTSESVGGTGVAFRAEGNSFLVLTSHHVVEFPETLDLEISSPLLGGERLLVGRGYRKSRSTVVGRPAEGQAMATLVAFSVKNDLALLAADLGRFDPYVAPFPYEFGATDAVQAGNGVYVLGAPDGKFMVTWGVATPEAPSLLRVDTSTPAGYSGGAVLATRRDDGNLELVGMVRGTAGISRKVWEFDDTVVPGMRLTEADPSHVIARTLRTRDFGVTYCTPVDRVRSFLERGLEYARRPHLLAPKNLDAD